MAQTLFQMSDLTLGARVEFYFQWSRWIKSFNESNQVSPTEEKEQSIGSIASTLGSNQSTISVNSSDKMINLNAILNSNAYGQSLLETLKSTSTNQLNENLRKILCESILQYCIMNKHDLTTQHCASLAKQICTLFPKEEMVYCRTFSLNFFFFRIL